MAGHATRVQQNVTGLCWISGHVGGGKGSMCSPAAESWQMKTNFLCQHLWQDASHESEGCTTTGW